MLLPSAHRGTRRSSEYNCSKLYKQYSRNCWKLLYGGYIDSCKGFYGLDTGGIAAFRKIFHYNASNPSVVSSDPVSVCFCSLTNANTLEPNCKNKKSWVTVYPGELFHIPVVSDEWDCSWSSARFIHRCIR